MSGVSLPQIKRLFLSLYNQGCLLVLGKEGLYIIGNLGCSLIGANDSSNVFFIGTKKFLTVKVPRQPMKQEPFNKSHLLHALF